jgi:single-strand DNA-binding protein
MFQQVTLIGNLGDAPEMRYTPSGTPVASFSLAVNKAWTTQDGERQEKTTWFRVTVWRKQAEMVAQFLTKGRQVLVVGEMQEAHAWSDKEGNPRATLEVTAQFVKFLGSRGEGENGSGPTSTDVEEETEDIPF